MIKFGFVRMYGMCKVYLIITTLCMVLVAVGCTKFPESHPTTMPTSFPKQPEPHSPVIMGQFLGLPDNALITLRIYTTSGQKIQWGTRRGNGIWEAVIPNNPGIDYVVTAEVEGYSSTPTSYTIHVDGKTAFLIEKSRVTTKEALHLDYYFSPVATPTLNK